MMILMILLVGGGGVWDLNDDDDDGTISSKTKKIITASFHSLIKLKLIHLVSGANEQTLDLSSTSYDISDESNIVHLYKLKFIEPVIVELRPSPECTVEGCILS